MSPSAAACWFNGAASTERLALSRGLHYGDGVFRTLLKFDGRLVDIEAQLDKLVADAAALAITAHDPELLLKDITDFSTVTANCVIKILLIRAGGDRGYRPQNDGGDCILLRYPLPEFDGRCWTEGITAFRSPVTMAAQPLLAGVKHLNRLEQVLASRGWPDGVDEAILCNEAGAPVCGTRSNLFWLSRKLLQTPSMDHCGVAGVMRAKILACAGDCDLEVRINRQDWASLLAADEAFICNSLIGIWPLRRLESRTWDAPGPMTAGLMRQLAHPKLSA